MLHVSTRGKRSRSASPTPCSPAWRGTAVSTCLKLAGALPRHDRGLCGPALRRCRQDRDRARSSTAKSPLPTSTAWSRKPTRASATPRVPARPGRRQPFRAGAVPRPDARLQGRGHAAPRAADGPRPKARGGRATIVAATSGDTGSAAVEAFRGLDQVDVFILYPHGRVSDVQRRQMTGVDAERSRPRGRGHLRRLPGHRERAVQTTRFRDELNLSGVNSINWARVAAQTVYYFTAAVALGGPYRKISFAVPTGNFGDILAGWVAKRMGLPSSADGGDQRQRHPPRTLTGGAMRPRRNADHLALHGHPGVVQFRAPPVRGAWARRGGGARADGESGAIARLHDRGGAAGAHPPGVFLAGGR